MKTHVQKTLEALQRAGSTGVHSFHLNAIVGTTRSAARIEDLKKQGYQITSQFEKMGDSMGVRYFLNEAPKKQFRWEFKTDEKGRSIAYQVQI